ncbi:beta-galactosidase [Actinoplanes solisilvae]|uniref:beta-galactosidase n=1 Tax=Actinoplanes solisilvae TaxID=2486853 RepID=UPI000FD86716|nr:beta-galactosidase [Actinoplanes solisilvae]
MPQLSNKFSTGVSVVAVALSAGLATTAITPTRAAAANAVTYDSAVLADRPLGYWPLNESSGQVRDLTGNFAASTVSIGKLGGEGAVGTGASFDGVRQQIRVPYKSTMRLPTSFSMEVWAKLPENPQTTGWPTIFSRGATTAGRFGSAMWVSSDAAHTVHFKRNGLDLGTTRGLSSSSYRQLVFTFDGTTRRWSWFVDGTLDNTGAAAGLAGTDTETAPLAIGTMLNSATASPVQYGRLKLDNISIYPTALSASRVAAHFAAARPSSTPASTTPASTPVSTNPTTAPTTTPTSPAPVTSTPTGGTGTNRYVAGVALGFGAPWSSRRAADFQAMRAANATWIRADLGWQYLEPVQGDWRWTNFDAVIADANASGLRYLAILHTVPGWANNNVGDYGPARDTSLLTNYCYRTAKRYIPMGVTDYEIGNEVNLPHPGLMTPDGASYARDTLVPCVAGVRKAAAELGTKASVVFGALAPTEWTGGADAFQFLTDAYANGAKGLVDALGWHPYTGSFTPAASEHMNADSARLNSIMVANGDGAKKIWATEYGQPSGGPYSVTEERQAADLSEALDVWYAKPFAGPMFYYNGRDTGTAPDDREQHFGLLRNDGSEKPAYGMLKSRLTR